MFSISLLTRGIVEQENEILDVEENENYLGYLSHLFIVYSTQILSVSKKRIFAFRYLFIFKSSNIIKVAAVGKGGSY